jgi:tRNA(fMet)-specific endonuclease VapC
MVIERRRDYTEEVAISFMSVAELFYGAEKSDHKRENKALVSEFLYTVDIIHSDLDILKKFGEIKSNLGSVGNILADADIFIAATAAMRCEMLITGNVKHFNRIAELRIENWLR